MLKESIRNELKSINKQELLYYLAYVLYVLSASFFVNVYKPISHLLKVISFAIAFLLCLKNFSKMKKQVLISNIFIAIFIIILGLKIDYRLIMLFLFIYGYCCGNFINLLRVDFFVRGVGVIATISSCFMGIAENNILETYRGVELVERYSLGFTHPNSCFLMIFILLTDFMLLKIYKNGKLNFIDIIVTVSITFVFEKITNSRAGAILIILLIFLLFIETNFNIIERLKKFSSILRFSSIIGLFVSIFLVVIYIIFPEIGVQLNNIATNRISSMYRFFCKYGISIIGQSVEKLSTSQALATTGKALVLDNLYANLLISYGLIFSILYFYLHIWLSDYLLKKKMYSFLLVFCVFSVYGLVEGMPLNIDYNYFFFIAIKALSEINFFKGGCKKEKYEY